MPDLDSFFHYFYDRLGLTWHDPEAPPADLPPDGALALLHAVIEDVTQREGRDAAQPLVHLSDLMQLGPTTLQHALPVFRKAECRINEVYKPRPTPPDVVSGGEAAPASLSLVEVVERLGRIQHSGERWTSYEKMAKRLGCAKGTVHKAIGSIPALQSWAGSRPKAQRERSNTDEFVRAVAKSHDLDSSDQIIIREYLEREDLEPDERAWANAQTPEDLLEYLKGGPKKS
jgi:hypothetical protein